MEGGPEQPPVKSIPGLRRLRLLQLNCSENGVFIVRVVNLGQNGALALRFFDFCKDVLYETPTFGTQIRKSSRTGSRKFTRFRAGDGPAQNFAADLMGLVKSFFEDFAS